MKTLKKIGKIFLYIIGGIIILLFIAGLFIDPIAKKVMENQVAQADEGQFSLVLDDVDISIIGGDFSIKGVVLETDTTHPASPPIILLEANEISVEGVSWLTYLLDSRLLMDQVLLENLNLELYARTVDSTNQENQENPKPFRLQQLDVYPMIKDQIDRFRLKDLTFNDITLTLVNLSTQDTLNFQSKELNLQSDDILIDADKLITDNRTFYATEMDFEGKEVVVNRSGNKTLVAKGKYIKFETLEDNIGLLTEGVNFLQTGDQESDTLMSMELEKFLLSNLGMNRIQEDSTGHIDKIAFSNLHIVNNFPTSPDTTLVPDSTKAAQQMNIAEFSLGKSLPGFLTQIELEVLDLSHISYRQGTMLRLEDANLLAQEIVVNKKSAFAENRFMHAADVEGSFKLFSFSMGDDSVYVTATGFGLDIEKGLGSLGLEEIKIKPAEKVKDEMWIDAELGAFALVGLNTQKITEKILSIDSIGFATPKVVVNMPKQSPTKNSASENSGDTKSEESPALDLYPAIEGILESVYLRKFALIDADIKASGLMPGPAEVVHIPTFYLQVTDVEIAEGTAFSGNKVLHSGDIAMRVEEINLPMNDLHTLNLDLFRLSTREGFIEAKDFILDYNGKRGMIPQKADTGSVMSVKNELFLVDELDFQRLIQDNHLIAGLVKTEGLQIYMFVDSNKESSNNSNQGSGKKNGEIEKKEKAMPQEMIKQVEMPFNIKEFQMLNANLMYEELASGAEESGKAKVTDISVAAKNISNIKAQIRENPVLPVEINGALMGTGNFETSIKLDMLSDSNLVVVEGQLDTMKITKMNQFTEYTSRLGFESGEIYHLGWKVEMDDELAEGTLEMSYDDLKIQISENNNPSTSGILKKAGSFLANNLVLETDVAPESSKEPEKAAFSEERNKEETFPAYVIQGLISGFMELMVTIF